MKTRFVIQQETMDRLVRTLLEAPPVGIDCPVAYARIGDAEEWLFSAITNRSSEESAPSERSSQGFVHLAWIDGSIKAPRELSSTCRGVLRLGRGDMTGKIAAWTSRCGEIVPVDELYLVGPGLRCEPLLMSKPEASEADRLRWSRTRGVMGDAWDRMRQLHVGIIGAGRTGSVIARLLLRSGVSALTLIDPDTLHRQNLGEADDCVDDRWIGELKVTALADGLRRVCPRARINVVGALISSVRSVRALKQCDVLFISSDHDAARLTGTTIAACYSRPLIDVATGITLDEKQVPYRQETNDALSIQMGLSVRLVLPGRCLACLGGLALSAAADVLHAPEGELAFHAGRNWEVERAGSLASLNEVAAALGIRMLEDLMMARLASSTWLQGNYDADGKLHIKYPEQNPSQLGQSNKPCSICASISAQGDAGLDRLPDLIRQLDKD